MKKTIVLFALAATFGASMPGVFAMGAHHHAAKPVKKAAVVSAVCPVMGTKIPDVKKAAGKSVYKGKTYYFCCGMCKPQFDKGPGGYAGKKK